MVGRKTERQTDAKAWNLLGRPLDALLTTPDVLAISAAVLGFFGEDLEVATSLVDRCLALNPSFARAGIGLACSGIGLANLTPPLSI
jgi:hypothetical protein